MKANNECSICGSKIIPEFLENQELDTISWGNNPQPYIKNGKMLKEEDRCCDKCNMDIVLPLRYANPSWREPIFIDPNDPNLRLY